MNLDRSTLRLLRQIAQADAATQGVVLQGNTTDLFVAADGSPCRLPYLLATWAAERGRATVAYSLAVGARQLTPPGGSPSSLRLPHPDEPGPQAIEELLRNVACCPHPTQVVISYADLVMPVTPSGSSIEQNRLMEVIGEFVIDPSASKRGHRVVMIGGPGPIDERIGRLPGFSVIEVSLPDHAERLIFIERLLAPMNGPALRLSRGLTAEQLASLSGGLALDDLYRARSESYCGPSIGPAWVQARKSATLSRLAGSNLIVYPPGNGLAGVAGLPQIRLLVRQGQVTGRPPRRLLLSGPPGVGKTLVVRAIADEFGYPAVGLGNFRSMWQGETERALRAVIGLVESLAPVVLHIDEIDQAIGPRGTGQSADGGTSERVLADLMTFLGDSARSERVLVIATTNRPELLDSAMFDRFTIVPVLHPTPAEGAQILRIAAEREGRSLDEQAAERAIERADQLLTGRVLIDILDRALTEADLGGSPKEVSEEHLRAAFADLLMALDATAHELLALRAIELTSFSSLLPWNAARALGESSVHVPAYVQRLLNHQGQLEPSKLRARLQELVAGHGAG